MKMRDYAEGLKKLVKAIGPMEDEDRIIGVDFTEGKDLTVITCNMSIDEFKKLNKLAEIGKATELALETLGYLESEYFKEKEYVVQPISFESTDELILWAKANEVVKLLREIKGEKK